MNNRNSVSNWSAAGMRPLSDFRREMDRLFDDFWSPSHASLGDSDLTPACDVEVADDHYLFAIEMPGIARDDIKIEVVDNQLTVSGERKSSTKSDGKGYRYTERRFGRFQRSFALPAGVDADKIEASCEDGVLHLMVPKAEEAKPRQIRIGEKRADGGNGFFGKMLGSRDEKENRPAQAQH
jgi:HSP20 family protein